MPVLACENDNLCLKVTQQRIGLDAGQLYHNNLASPLSIAHGALHYNPAGPWELPLGLRWPPVDLYGPAPGQRACKSR